MAAQFGSVFALLSLLLAGLGIYGLVSWWVTQRTAEFGIRLALGAGARNLLGLVLGNCLRLAGIGMATGLAASFWIARLISAFLYGVHAWDPIAFIVSPLILLAVAVLAALRSALHAIGIKAADALRSE